MKNTNFINDDYILEKPSSQNILNLFQNEWSTKMPIGSDLIALPGQADLMNDGRIHWINQELGGIEGFDILELGPLEAAHTLMMRNYGAKKITCVEANIRSFLKCLCIKEVFDLKGVKFLLGDAAKYVQDDVQKKFDLVVASGILYHLINPIEFLLNTSKYADTLFIWTHYYDRELIERTPVIDKFRDVVLYSTPFGTFEQYRYTYDDALNWAGFCGGHNAYSYWLGRKTIVDILKKCGFKDIRFANDDKDHQNGPAMSILAKR